MLLQALVDTSSAVGATRSRLAKREALSALLRTADDDDIEIVVSYLSGELRQRRTGIGWVALRQLPPPTANASLTVQGVDAALQRVSELSGPGSGGARTEAVRALFGDATETEQAFLRGLIAGELRQGALDAAMVDAVASASGVPLTVVRRAVMLRGATGPVAKAALTGGAETVAAFGLRVGQAVRPMLASTATDAAVALAKVSAAGAEVAVDAKLDGIRIQVHKSGDVIRVFTRSLDDITSRLPEVVQQTRRLSAGELILDGEAMTLDERGRARPFQETASRTASQQDPHARRPVSPFFFDILHVDGEDLIDRPLRDRLRRLDALVPPALRVGRLVTDHADEAAGFFTAAVAAGHEGVVVNSLDSTYDAGRRGAGWVKVKPRHTLDLVVLAVEWGSGRRRGLLSNIHLGARDPDGDADNAGFVMLGKTFKGMTDETLAWQTERFLGLEVSRSGQVVFVRPEQVVEIAFDGLQRSTRYAGGLALRFARVLRYRNDKTAEEADTITTVRALAGH